MDGRTIGYLGVGWAQIARDHYQTLRYTPLQSLAAAAQKTWDQSVFTVKMLARIVTG